MTREIPGVLFLCVANSARSQMGEALARRQFGNRVRVQSAGSHPTEINPFATEVLAELGLAVDGQHSKAVESVDPGTVDLVITLCAEEVCPAFLGSAERQHWPLPDPAGEAGSREQVLERFRDVRDELEARIAALASNWPA